MNNRPGRALWIVLICIAIGTPLIYWIYKMDTTGGKSAKVPPTNQHVRTVVVDFRNIPPKERAISDLKSARADVAMVWGLGRKDFEKLAAELGMVHYDYARGGFGVMSRWRLARPTVVNTGLMAEQNVAGRPFKIECGVSDAIQSGMGIVAAEGELKGFETVVGLTTGLNLGITPGWTVHDKGDFPSRQGGWVELGWE